MSKIVFVVNNKKTTFYVTNGMSISSSIWHTFLKLLDGPMRRLVDIRWTNRKTAGAVRACATQINQCTEFVDASEDDSDVR